MTTPLAKPPLPESEGQACQEAALLPEVRNPQDLEDTVVVLSHGAMLHFTRGVKGDDWMDAMIHRFGVGWAPYLEVMRGYYEAAGDDSALRDVPLVGIPGVRASLDTFLKRMHGDLLRDVAKAQKAPRRAERAAGRVAKNSTPLAGKRGDSPKSISYGWGAIGGVVLIWATLFIFGVPLVSDILPYAGFPSGAETYIVATLLVGSICCGLSYLYVSIINRLEARTQSWGVSMRRIQTVTILVFLIGGGAAIVSALLRAMEFYDNNPEFPDEYMPEFISLFGVAFLCSGVFGLIEWHRRNK